MQKKRHHFVPKAYLKAFCNPRGRVLVYRKDEPQKALPLDPDATQFRNYYYSQPTPNGGQDNNGLEDLFSTIESEWPKTVARLAAGGDVNDRLTNIFEFMSLQRVRVPAARDFAEAIDAQMVKGTFAQMYESGKLPFLPSGLEKLPDQVEVAIDPHRSIHSMVAMFQGMGRLYDSIGLVVAHNKTNRPFLSSDNPVLWFDPSVPFENQQPYSVSLDGGQVMLIFPVSPKLAIVGGTEYAKSYAKYGLTHIDVDDEKWILMANEQICRFAYEAVLASEPGQEELILQYADKSPVLETAMLPGKNSLFTIHHQVFGKRVPKPKW
jgi:hypothetical protein